MEAIPAYLLSLVLTLLTALMLTFLLKAALQRVLLDLCGTPERAQFWARFSMIMLISMPVVVGLGFMPLESGGEPLFFEMARQMRGNLLAYLFTLAVVGAFISIFALFAPRPKAAQ